MSKKKYRVIQDPVYGYKRLDPIPDDRVMADFYQKQYYALIREGGRGPQYRRIMAGGEDAERERTWYRATQYSDILTILEENRPKSKRLLDLGSGNGDFIAFMKENGWDVVGFELSAEAADTARSRGLTVYSENIIQFLTKHKEFSYSFTAITLLNVLEHVPNPVEILNLVKNLLARNGIVAIQVPNDFSTLQLIAQQQLEKEAWWVAIPDHINYFNYQSMYILLERLGFDIIYSQGDFPMELFLLMGDDYVNNPDVGNICHWKRVRFEMAIPPELRRSIYKGFAASGVGRDFIIFGRIN